LLKPDPNEFYDVTVLNNNFDKIDAAIGAPSGGGGGGFAPGTKPFGHMGRTQGFQAVSNTNNSIIGFTAAQILHGGVTFDAANNALIVPISGYYRVNIKGYASGGTAPYMMTFLAYRNGASLSEHFTVSKPDGNDMCSSASGIVSLNAGDKITEYCASNPAAGSNTWGTNGFNGTFIEIEWVDQ
jgi:hypothetical protein